MVIGEAAHITRAKFTYKSPCANFNEDPNYISSVDNGIWMCRINYYLRKKSNQLLDDCLINIFTKYNTIL